MTKIDIYSGFLGAGKTTLIKKLITEAYNGEKIVVIENEFGEIGIDGGFLKDSGIQINEMNSGCICCSLVGDFNIALKQVLNEYAPDRIIIEPSGVGKLSDVIKAVQGIEASNAVLNGYATVVDANKCKMYMKNFGEFFNDQIESAGCIVLSHTGNISDEKTNTCIELIKQHNKDAVIVTTPWDKLDGKQLLAAIERNNTLEADLHELEHHHKHSEECHCGHHHEHDEECHCGHHHEHDEECHCGHHHEHDEECHCGHHHEHDEECHCGHHHHHAEEVFSSWGTETINKYSIDEITNILKELMDEHKYGIILRAKGIVCGENGEWIHFDYVPEEPVVRTGTPDITGRICVIGSHINNDEIAKLFRI
ncbi:MAG: CobW family GTP-binding protein [Clostridia bacterium]|nr:CobW family GTP-binding protein [Clostridia bacterium]